MYPVSNCIDRLQAKGKRIVLTRNPSWIDAPRDSDDIVPGQLLQRRPSRHIGGETSINVGITSVSVRRRLGQQPLLDK